MANRTAPFSAFEFQIAWRYLRARRAEGGVSVMTWISLIGVTLGVMALVATLAVRAGFRAEFVDTIVGANAHVQVYSGGTVDAAGKFEPRWTDYDAAAERMRAIPGVARAANGNRNCAEQAFAAPPRRFSWTRQPRMATSKPPSRHC